MKIYLEHKNIEELVQSKIEDIKNGQDVVINDLDIVDELIFDEKYNALLKDAEFVIGDYTIGLKTAKDMRLSGYNILKVKQYG